MSEEDGSGAFDEDAIGKILMKAKTGGAEMTFAFGLTAKPEDCALIMHLRKPGPALRKEVKALPVKIAKSCFGTFTVAEGEVRLMPQKPVKGMIKQLKKRFRLAGMMKYTPVLVGPDGAVIDEDTLPDDIGDDDDDDAAVPNAPPLPPGQQAPQSGQVPPAPPPPGQPVSPEMAALRKRLAAIVPKVQALQGGIADKLRQACVLAGQQIAASDPAAGATVTRIEEVLGRQAQGQTPPQAPPQPGTTGQQPPAPPPPPEVPLARLQETMGKIIQRIRALPEGDARNMLTGQAREIVGFINGSDVERAMTGIRTLTQDLLAAEATPKDDAPKEDAMTVWRDAKESVDVSISALQNVLKGIDDPDLQRIADAGLNGITDGLQSKLMAALFDFNSARGEARVKAGQVLVSRAGDLRKLIEGDPIIALCEDNPFGVKVAIRAPLSAALTRLENLATAA